MYAWVSKARCCYTPYLDVRHLLAHSRHHAGRLQAQVLAVEGGLVGLLGEQADG